MDEQLHTDLIGPPNPFDTLVTWDTAEQQFDEAVCAPSSFGRREADVRS